MCRGFLLDGGAAPWRFDIDQPADFWRSLVESSGQGWDAHGQFSYGHIQRLILEVAVAIGIRATTVKVQKLPQG